MTDNNLKLTITASLNIGTSLKSINESIQAIEKHPSLQKIKIKLDIDTSTLNSFISAVNRMKKISDDQKQVVQESIDVYKKLDGSVTQITSSMLKNGEVIQKTKTVHDENKKAMQDEAIAAQKLAEAVDRQNKADLDSVSVLRNKANAIKGYKVTSSEGYSVTTTRLESDAQTLVGSSTTTNYKKQRDDDKKAQEEFVKATHANLLQEEQEWSNFVTKQESNFQKLKSTTNKGLLQEEQEWDSFVSKQKKTFDTLTKDLELYKQQASIDVQNSQRRFGDTVDQGALSKYLSDVKSLSVHTPDLKNQMDKLSMSFKEIGANAQTSGSHAITFSEALATSFQKFPVWLISGTVFMQSLHFFTDGIKYVNELNATLTQISTAVNYNQEKVAQLGKTYQALGVEMGATTKDIASGALEFYRQGLGDEEVLKRMKLTTEYAKISGLDFKQSAELLTAASTSMHTDITTVADTFTLLGK